jgi:hypothetical protein
MFERGTLEGWTAGVTGVAELVSGNGWGNRVCGWQGEAGTGTSNWELHLARGGTVAQAVTGLRPGQAYRLSGWLRVGGPGDSVELRVRDWGGAPRSVRCTSVGWERVEVDFVTGPDTSVATVDICQDTDAPVTAHAWADNLGLVELDSQIPTKYERFIHHSVAERVASRLGIGYASWMQDWPLEVGDFKRVSEFVERYRSEAWDPDERFALMQVILYSFEERSDTDQIRRHPAWEQTCDILISETDLHAYSVLDLGGVYDPESAEDCAIAPLLQDLYRRKLAAKLPL